jgi:hypothetical protein
VQPAAPARLAPRRPPPPPPAAAAATAADDDGAPPPDEHAFVEVDGLPCSTVEAWFADADADGDGRVADEEARAFFLRSGLGASSLSTIWRVVKPAGASAQAGKGLSRRRFSQALRLVALAQSGLGFTPEAAAAALGGPRAWAARGGGPLPPPRVLPAAAAAAAGLEFLGVVGVEVETQQGGSLRGALSRSLHRSQRVDDGAVAAAVARAEAREAGAAAGPHASLDLLSDFSIPEGAPCDDDDDIFGLASLRQAAAAAAPAPAEVRGGGASGGGGGDTPGSTPGSSSAARSLARTRGSRGLGGSGRLLPAASNEPPLRYDLRLPPLNPKLSAKLAGLAGANGCLFAAPAAGGGALQWARAEGDAGAPSAERPPSRDGGVSGPLCSCSAHTQNPAPMLYLGGVVVAVIVCPF